MIGMADFDLLALARGGVPWTRTLTLPVNSLDQRLITYRASSLGIARLPKITIARRA